MERAGPARRWKAVGATAAGSAGAGVPVTVGAPAVATAKGKAKAKACSPPNRNFNCSWEGGPVAIIGGGLSGLACGWALKRRGLPAVVLDTGKRGPGGRASSRIVSLDGHPQPVDHAVQAFTVKGAEVKALLQEAEQAAALRRWSGPVGTLTPQGEFKDFKDPTEANDVKGSKESDNAGRSELWIGSSEVGMGSLANWLAAEQAVVRDVWVAKLVAASEKDWSLLDQRGQPVSEHPSYRYVVMAHNGKCADRLIKTAPVSTVAHAPLRCRFTSTASATSDRLELSSLWVCIVAAPPGVACFEGAFVEGHESLSWLGNNSAKYSSASAGGAPATSGARARPNAREAWTLISTPGYGTANKCPQEAIPAEVRNKVSRELCVAFAKLLRRDLQLGSGPGDLEVLHLQLWGAALPLNVCHQHFIHDPEACVGVCGDWLSAPSVEGALSSGLALAEAIEAHFCKGGLQNTGARRFEGLRDAHAIGSFEFNSAGTGAGTGARAGAGAGGGAGAGAPAGKGAGRGAGAGAGAESESESDLVWYFGFGANINPWKLREQRKIRPVEQVQGRLPGWRLVFSHKGGMGSVERLSSQPQPQPQSQPGNGEMPMRSPDAVHGVLLLLRRADFRRLAQMEHEYCEQEVTVQAYDGRALTAVCFVSQPQWRLRGSLAPPERYLKLIRDGCQEMAIDEDYQSWLATLPSVRGQRGPEYWAVPANAGEPAPATAATAASSSRAEGPLRLGALASFAVQDGKPLVDIGANLGKCSPQDLAQQLVRAAAARVGHMLLTGCSVRSSQDAQRLAAAWTGPQGLQACLRHLGAAARGELEATGLTEAQLPALHFTAGVHPHEAKTCTGETLGILRSLAADPRCVAIGECGLDYDRMFTQREVQQTWCQRQVELAVELGLPLFLHERDRDEGKGPPLGSCQDLLRILDRAGVDPTRVCIHCFTGSREALRAYVSRGFSIGLTGFVGMQKRGEHIRDFLRQGDIPLKQLMIETDCPFMMPDKRLLPNSIGMQGRRNEACAMPAVCRAAAECLGVSPGAVASATTDNAERFFQLART